MPRTPSSLISSLPHIRAFRCCSHGHLHTPSPEIFCTFRLLPSPSLVSIWLQHQLHGPQVIQERQKESKPCDTDTYISLSLLVLSHGTENYQKGAGMGYHPDTAYIYSVNYKQENLWGGCGQLPKTALVFFFSWCCTSGSPSRLELRQHTAAWGLLCAWT